MPEIYLSPDQKMSHVEAIVHEFPEVAGLQAYEYFRSSATDQKKAFINGELTKLDLTYPDLNLDSIQTIKSPMLRGLVTLMPGEKTLKIRSLYDAVEYRYSELFMMDMARVMNSDAVSTQEREEAEQWFVQANESLYGKPDKDVFSALATKAIVERTFVNAGDSDTVVGLRQELQNLTGQVENSDFVPFKPTDALVNKIGNLVHDRFDYLVSHVDEGAEYNVDEMADALDIALNKMGGKELGWRVEIVPNSSALSVSAHQKLVEVGVNRTVITGKTLKGRILHEEGVHAGRSIRAEKAGWLSAAYGQDGYLDFEEAFAAALEDAYRYKFTDRGANYQLIAGLAYGYDNHVPRDFYETFEIMWRVNALGKIDDGNVTESIIEKAKSNAFVSCLRLFRGTTGLQKGVVYLKDLAYFNGQESAWSVLKDVETQKDLDLLFAGKLDNSRSDHQAIAKMIVEV